jgi:hypothetical protein
MSYLYGDSTPSKLEGNYIEFLRDAVEFCVQLLLSDQRVAQGKTQTRSLEHATVAEVERLQKLAPLVTKAFEGTTLGAADSPTARTAGAISKAAHELVRAEAVRMRDALDAEIAKRDADAAQEREGAVKALEQLMVKHELPGSVSDLHVTLAAGGRYGARARTKTPFGLETLLDLEVPASHLFEKVVRVDRLAEKLDVQAPEVGGWMRKEVKRRPQHLEKHHVIDIATSADGATLKLRIAPDGTGAGFDVLFSKEAPHVRMLRVAEQQPEGQAEQPFEVDEEDAKKLVVLYSKLATAATELTGHRRRVVDAKLDNEAMRNHSKPTLLAERLIATMTPVVQEIAARSHSPGELVLRRLLSGDRREEIFLSKSELKQKLEPLSEANRALFDPLWLIVPPAPAGKTDAPHSQTVRYHTGTPALGMPPLGASSTPSAAAPPAKPPVAAAAATPPPPPPSGDTLRTTLIGAAVQDVPVPPADSVSKTPLAAVPHIEALRKEAAGTIESAVAKQVDKQVDPTTRS